MSIVKELNLFLNYAAASGTYNMAGRDIVIVCDTSSAVVTVNLVPATGQGRTVYIKDNGNASTNSITINPDGSDTIDGQLSATISNSYDCITLVSNGSGKWYII